MKGREEEEKKKYCYLKVSDLIEKEK